MALKHIGRLEKTGRKVAVAFRTLPDDPESCLVVQTENLGDSEHDVLMNLVESNTGQNAEELADAMQRTQLTDGSTMLPSFHARGKLTKVATADVTMTPDNSTTVNLAELNKIIADQKGISISDLAVGGSSVTEVGSGGAVATPEVQAQAVAKTDEPLSDDDLAKNLRADADRLFKEATELRKQADELAPVKKASGRGKS